MPFLKITREYPNNAYKSRTFQMAADTAKGVADNATVILTVFELMHKRYETALRAGTINSEGGKSGVSQHVCCVFALSTNKRFRKISDMDMNVVEKLKNRLRGEIEELQATSSAPVKHITDSESDIEMLNSPPEPKQRSAKLKPTASKGAKSTASTASNKSKPDNTAANLAKKNKPAASPRKPRGDGKTTTRQRGGKSLPNGPVVKRAKIDEQSSPEANEDEEDQEDAQTGSSEDMFGDEFDPETA